MIAVRICYSLATALAWLRDFTFLLGRLLLWPFYQISRGFDWAARRAFALGVWLEGT